MKTINPPVFTPNFDGEPIADTFCEPGESYSLGFHNDDAENGYGECSGPLSWVNSARITLDPEEDAVHLSCSVGDPRGAFCFTIRRNSKGALLIHTPYPGEGMPHMETEPLHTGTLKVKGNNIPESAGGV